MSKNFLFYILILFNFFISLNCSLIDTNALECEKSVDYNNCEKIDLFEPFYKCCKVSYKYKDINGDEIDKNFCTVINNKYGNYFKNYKKSLKKKYSKVKIECNSNYYKIKIIELLLFLLLIL